MATDKKEVATKEEIFGMLSFLQNPTPENTANTGKVIKKTGRSDWQKYFGDHLDLAKVDAKAWGEAIIEVNDRSLFKLFVEAVEMLDQPGRKEPKLEVNLDPFMNLKNGFTTENVEKALDYLETLGKDDKVFAGPLWDLLTTTDKPIALSENHELLAYGLLEVQLGSSSTHRGDHEHRVQTVATFNRTFDLKGRLPEHKLAFLDCFRVNTDKSKKDEKETLTIDINTLKALLDAKAPLFQFRWAAEQTTPLLTTHHALDVLPKAEAVRDVYPEYDSDYNSILGMARALMP